MQLLTDLLQFIVRYRLHIGILAGMTALIPFQSSIAGIIGPEGALNWNAVMAALAIGMLVTSINLSNKLTDAGPDSSDPRTLPLTQPQYRRILKISQILFGLPVLWLVFIPPVLVVYIIFGASLGYLFNYGLPWGGKRHRIKNVFLLKNIVPAASYAICVAAPYALLAPDAVPAVFLLHAVSAFTMILLHELLGDMRDLNADKAAGVRTLPNMLGVSATKIVAVVLMLVYVAYIYLVTNVPAANLPPTFVVMAAIFLIANAKRQWWYYQLYIFLWLAIVAIDLFV